MKPARATMRDVARMAGVSIATVSAVINRSANVSPAATRRVRDAMAELRYQPDQLARGLKVGKTFVIGVVVPDITNLFYPEVVLGVEDAAQEQGYSVILCNSNEDSERESRHIDILLSRRVDGVLLACSDATAGVQRLEERDFPFILLDRVPPGRPWAIATDNVAAGCVATRHLIELGHTRIAAIAGNTRLSPHRDRMEGYRRALLESGLALQERLIQESTQRIESGFEAARELLSLADPPTAILSTNNRMLLGVMRAIADLGLACPRQVSVIGFDDYNWTRHHTPKLTVMAQPTYEMGREAMRLLLRRIAGDPGAGAPVLLKAELRVRESTAPPMIK